MVDVSKEIELLKKHENLALELSKEGYYIAFSGGKDSIVMADIFKKSGCKGQMYFSNTGVELPEIPIFIKHNYPNCIILKPQKTMWQLIEQKGLPTRRMRFCCSHLKEYGGSNRLVLTGVRAKESVKRSKRKQFEHSCAKGTDKIFLHVIFDWDEKKVWQYIKENSLPYPQAYDNGKKRIGCIGCPMGTHKEKELNQYPNIKKAYYKATVKRFEKIFDKYKDNPNRLFNTADEYWQWWLSNMTFKDWKLKRQQTKIEF